MWNEKREILQEFKRRNFSRNIFEIGRICDWAEAQFGLLTKPSTLTITRILEEEEVHISRNAESQFKTARNTEGEVRLS